MKKQTSKNVSMPPEMPEESRKQMAVADVHTLMKLIARAIAREYVKRHCHTAKPTVQRPNQGGK